MWPITASHEINSNKIDLSYMISEMSHDGLGQHFSTQSWPLPFRSTGISRKGGGDTKLLHFPGRGPLIDRIPVSKFFQEKKINPKKKWCTFFEQTGYRNSLLETVTGNSNNFKLIPRVFKVNGTSMTVNAICQPMVLVLGCERSKKYFSWCPRRPHPLRRSDVAKYRISEEEVID